MGLADFRRMARRPARFEVRLGVTSSVLVAVACAGLSWQLARGALADLRAHLGQRATTVVTALASEASVAMQRGDLQALGEAAARAHAQGDVLAVRVFDAHGLVLVASGVRGGAVVVPPLDRLPSDAVDVPDGIELWHVVAGAPGVGPLGAVAVSLSTGPLDALRRRILVTASVLTLVFMAMGAAAAFGVARALTRPLAELARATQAVAAGDFTARVVVGRGDELGTVGSAFNVMAETVARSHRTLEDKVAELERANHLKSEFLATVSHELRTPLNVIIGHSEMLRDVNLGSGAAHDTLVETIQRYAELQLDLVTSVLDFEHLSAGTIECRVESFDLGPLVDDVLALHTGRLKPGVQLQGHVAVGCPTLETDRIKVHQIVRNLVDNAVKFTESGRIVVEATPSVRPDHVTIAVTDTGPGVPVGDLPHIFEPFHQLGSSSTRRTTGVGLGLSIVQRLVEVLGGTISVSSEPGWGSTFRADIPRRLPDGAPKASAPPTRAGSRHAA
jgi:signal transduction histidine kinase